MKTLQLASAVLLASIVLTACNDNDTSTAPTAVAPTSVVTASTGEVTMGMSEEAVTTQQGAAILSQTNTLDDMTITHSEWTDEKGTLSVQFINGKVQFSQYTPAIAE